MKIYVLAINQAKSDIKISNRYSIELRSTKLIIDTIEFWIKIHLIESKFEIFRKIKDCKKKLLRYTFLQ